MFAYMFDDVSDDGNGLREEMNQFYTFIGGQYVSWPDYVARRRAPAMSGNERNTQETQ